VDIHTSLQVAIGLRQAAAPHSSLSEILQLILRQWRDRIRNLAHFKIKL
jgi:hypothetical protein